MKRTEKLNRYCIGRNKGYVAETELGIKRQALSYILRIDLDDLIARIDALELDETRQPRPRRTRKVAA